MVKKSLIVFTLTAAWLLFLSSCSVPDATVKESPTAVPTATPTADIEVDTANTDEDRDRKTVVLPYLPDWSKTPEPEPVELPYPESEIYGLEGIDAVMFDAAVQEFSTRYSAGDLLIPSLAVLDTFETDDGTHYICWIKACTYLYLGFGLDDLDDPKYSFVYSPDEPGYDQSTYVIDPLFTKFIISSGDEGEPVCIYVDGDLDTSLFKRDPDFFGPLEELEVAARENYYRIPLTEKKPLPVEPRWITPEDPEELLDIYLDHYFR